MAALGFWLFLAVIVIAGALKKMNGDKLKHETMRLLIEKNQKLDELQLKELINPTPLPSPEWIIGRSTPGDAYRGARVAGTILIFIALGLFIACISRVVVGVHDKSTLDLWAGVVVLAMLGIGLFVSSRFLPRPSDEHKDNKGLK
jgi:hypothetical protein